MTPVPAEAVRRFRAIVTRRFGLHVGDDQHARLADTLRAHLNGRTVDDYLASLERTTPDEAEFRALAGDLTVSETYFFRNHDQFLALADVVLPQLAAPDPRRPIQVLSAGAASGEEAYSIAIVANQCRRLEELGPVRILGIDVSPRVLQQARRGHYSEWALRGTPESVRTAFFERRGREFAIRQEVARAVRFEERNLVNDDPAFWRGGRFDVVFFRNTLMYLAPDMARQVVARISHALAPGGYLFLGHAETLRGLSDAYELHHTHGTFYYRRRDDRPVVESCTAPAGHRGQATLPPQRWPQRGSPAADTAWFQVIGDATARVAHVVDEALGGSRRDAASHTRAGPGVHRAPHRTQRVSAALALLGEDRFEEALAALASEDTGPDADLLVMRAAILTSLGRFDAARLACEAVLRVEPLSAGAHCLLGLQARHAGDVARARQHQEAAMYLDPTFAMPPLHLGILERRTGHSSPARLHLAMAAQLLQREDTGRLLLFGGGFTREALLRLCEAELQALERAWHEH